MKNLSTKKFIFFGKLTTHTLNISIQVPRAKCKQKITFSLVFLAQKAGCEVGLAGRNDLNIWAFSRNLWLMNENPVLGAFRCQDENLLR